MRSRCDPVLHIEIQRVGVGAHALAEGLALRRLAREHCSAAEGLRLRAHPVELDVAGVAARAQVVRRLVLRNVVLEVARTHARLQRGAERHREFGRGRRRLEVLVHGREEKVRVLARAFRTPVAQRDAGRADVRGDLRVDAQVVEAAVRVVGRAGRETVAVEPRYTEVELGRACGDAAVHAGLARVVVAVADFRRPALACAAARDHVDDAADRVRAVEGRARALHDLDALDERRRDVLQRGEPDGARVDAHAVDQHQRVIALRAADEHRGRLPRPAVAREVEARVEAQQVGGVACDRALDRVAIDHDDRSEHFLDRGRDARGSDDDVTCGEACRGIVRCRGADRARFRWNRCLRRARRRCPGHARGGDPKNRNENGETQR